MPALLGIRSSVNIAVNGLRFLYAVTLQRSVAELLSGDPRMRRNTLRAYYVEERPS